MAEKRIYFGYRLADGCHVWRKQGNNWSRLEYRLDIHNHSPAGFEWGYGGSGPAQLSLALIADVTGNDFLAEQFHQKLKAVWTSKQKGQTWELPEDKLLGILSEWIVNLGAVLPAHLEEEES